MVNLLVQKEKIIGIKIKIPQQYNKQTIKRKKIPGSETIEFQS
jgi:hypothetical protein